VAGVDLALGNGIDGRAQPVGRDGVGAVQAGEDFRQGAGAGPDEVAPRPGRRDVAGAFSAHRPDAGNEGADLLLIGGVEQRHHLEHHHATQQQCPLPLPHDSLPRRAAYGFAGAASSADARRGRVCKKNAGRRLRVPDGAAGGPVGCGPQRGFVARVALAPARNESVGAQRIT
jgi:hypothetical protein